MIAGVAAGFVIGIVAALLGVAGGELLIPTLVLLFGADIKLAGSLSLAVSLPTMLVGFARYSRDRSFVVLGENRRFVLVMAAGSICGSFIGGRLLGLVPSAVLLPLLAVILILSAVKVWRHHCRPACGTRMMVANIDVTPGSPSWLRLARLAKLLSSATLVWLSIEGAIGVVAGVLAAAVTTASTPGIAWADAMSMPRMSANACGERTNTPQAAPAVVSSS